jgi:outer membrane protein OmpA-like peptidoglycan-associated protein
MRVLLACLALLLGLLAGCSMLPSSAPGAATGAGPQRSLESEQRRLATLFRGTPVVFEMQRDGSLQVTVPLEFSFAPGRAAVKPPLAAVLDRVASSQRETATRFRVMAPADPARRNTRLAQERAASTRDYLVARGIAPTRFVATEASAGDLVLVAVMQAID